MVRDVYAYGLWNQMGHWGPRTRMCEVVVNNEYMGVYAFCERIKRDKNRVDIAKLKPEDTTGRDVSGGYIVRIDAFDNEDVTFQSKVMGIQKSNWGWGGSQSQESPVTWTIYYPKKEDLIDAQKQYIQNYVDSAELAIQSPDSPTPKRVTLSSSTWRRSSTISSTPNSASTPTDSSAAPIIIRKRTRRTVRAANSSPDLCGTTTWPMAIAASVTPIT